MVENNSESKEKNPNQPLADGLPCSWFMNINGVNSTDNEEVINIKYTGREIISSGNSSFSRMKGKSVNVGEYFYYKLV